MRENILKFWDELIVECKHNQAIQEIMSSDVRDFV